MMKSHRIVISLFLVAAAVGIGYSLRLIKKPMPVTVATVRIEPIEGTFTAEGFVRGKEYALAPDVSGKVIWIGVQEGQPVQRGTELLRLDDQEQSAAALQAESAVQTARIGVQEAQTQYRLTRSQVNTRREGANANLREKEAQYRRVLRGARMEEIEQARHRVEQTQAEVEEARRRYERAVNLLEEGAISRSEKDAAELPYKTAKARLEEFRDALALLQSGPLPEEREAAAAAVSAARAEVKASQQADQELEARLQQVELAQARLTEALAAQKRTTVTRGKNRLFSPVAGIVTRVRVEVGAMVLPGTPPILLSTREDLHIEAEVSSEDMAKAAEKMPVTITAAAFPGQSFPGRITRLSAVGELKPDAGIRTRIVRARVVLDRDADLFKPGMEVDVQGTRELKKALTIPSDALVQEGSRIGVYVVSGDRVSLRPVEIGYADITRTEILSGVKEGDRVVLRGKEGLQEGQTVRIQP